MKSSFQSSVLSIQQRMKWQTQSCELYHFPSFSAGYYRWCGRKIICVWGESLSFQHFSAVEVHLTAQTHLEKAEFYVSLCTFKNEPQAGSEIAGRSSRRSVVCTVRRWCEGQKKSISKSAVGQLCYIRCRMPGIALPPGLPERGV